VTAIEKHLASCPDCSRKKTVEELLQASFVAQTRLNNTAGDDADEPPIIRIAHTILQQGILQGAKEIHIDPDEHGLRILWADEQGETEGIGLPGYVKNPLIARLKKMAGIDPEQVAIQQRGSMSIQWGENRYEMPVETMQTEFGERVVVNVSGQ
jgi:type II secretory ATPase GspE/PulE/Tfp pilus assembly ATPase PilB-like protein